MTAIRNSRAKHAVLLGSMIMGLATSSLSQAQVVTSHDIEIAITGFAGYKIYRAVQANGQFSPRMNQELASIASELSKHDSNIARLQNQAKVVEAGEPNVRNRTIYEGRYLSASEYKNRGTDAQALASSQYRLQPADAQKLQAVILEEAAGREGSIRLTMERVNGTLDGSIQMGESVRVTGTPEAVTQKMVEVTNAHNAGRSQGSVVRVSIEFDLPRIPDAARAATMRTQAETLVQERSTLEQKVTNGQAEVRKSYAGRVAGVRKQIKVSVMAIAGAAALFWVRDSFAQGMINLGHACGDEASLRTHATGWAIQTGESFERVYQKAQELCARP